MERIYKTIDGRFALCVSATVKTLPFHVWRDLIRHAYCSIDLNVDLDSGHGEYDFPNQECLDKAVAVLNGALFKEVTADEWENWKSGIDKE